MHFLNERTRTKRIVSLTPLIDVVFILLVFFMLVSNFSKYHAIEVNAPAPSTKQNTNMEGSLLIRLSEDGEIDIAGKPASLDKVTEIVKNALDKKPNQQVLIKPHKELAIQEIVNLVDELAILGITNFSFIK
ncbi:MAG: biopolymer transporter ExbD [Pseudomonadota bacterium]